MSWMLQAIVAVNNNCLYHVIGQRKAFVGAESRGCRVHFEGASATCEDSVL